MKPFDLTKFSKEIAKKNTNLQVGFTDPKVWIDTGNYALNYRISSDFHKGFPLEGKMTVLAGESGAGKSYIVSGSCVRYCQQHGIQTIIIDTERAIDDKWIRALGVDPENPLTLKLNAALIDDLTNIIMSFLESYKAENAKVPPEERTPVLLIIDSLGMATTKTEVEQAEKGDNKGDMGRKQKQIYNLCRTFLASVGDMPIGIVATQHTYVSQDMFSKDDIVAGGSGLQFTPSVLIAMRKHKTKMNDDGTKSDNVTGVHVDAMIRKSRYAKPFQPVEFNIPYDTGLDPYSGLFELFSDDSGLKYADGTSPLSMAGAYVVYKNPKGEECFKKYRKAITHEDFDLVMKDYMEYKQSNPDKLEEDDDSIKEVDNE